MGNVRLKKNEKKPLNEKKQKQFLPATSSLVSSSSVSQTPLFHKEFGEFIECSKTQTESIEKLFESIVVADEWNMSNGLIDLNRDVLMKVIKLIFDHRKIRNIVGMTSIFYEWSKQRIFRWAREASFRLNPKGGIEIKRIAEGLAFSFSVSHRTIFLKNIINKGIFRWLLRIHYGMTGSFRLGAAPPERVPFCDDSRLGDIVKGTCAFLFWKSDFFTVKAAMLGADGCSAWEPMERGVPDASLVAVEIDANQKTLCFFVEEKLVPHAICDLRFPMCLGISASYKPSFVSVSFKYLQSPTTFFATCKYHRFIG